uniref:Uncharacterized protein n=1 Tax=Anguilla anguilla TaxID=7936 RepID=A0A0E9SGZ1_ANGAN
MIYIFVEKNPLFCGQSDDQAVHLNEHVYCNPCKGINFLLKSNFFTYAHSYMIFHT